MTRRFTPPRASPKLRAAAPLPIACPNSPPGGGVKIAEEEEEEEEEEDGGGGHCISECWGRTPAGRQAMHTVTMIAESDDGTERRRQKASANEFEEAELRP
eukprot:1023109-Pyramimonas_sp.AAC.1